MGDYSRSGADAVASGSLAIGSIARDMQEAQVRPRELEAATSLAESRAKVAKFQATEMQTMAGLSEETAQRMKDSGEAMTLHNGQKEQLKTLVQHGKWEAASGLQTQMQGQEAKIWETQSKAAEAQINQNEVTSSKLLSLGSTEDLIGFANTTAESAKAKAKEDPTPENQQAAAQAQAVQARIISMQNAGKTWPEIQKSIVEPTVNGLKSNAQRALELKTTSLAEERRVAADERERHDREMERNTASATAARRENQGVSKQLTLSVATAKLTESHDKYRNELLAKMEKLDPTVAEKRKDDWVKHDYPNPALAKLQESLDRSDKIHNDNLKGLQTSSETGKAFVPKPYSDAEKKDKLPGVSKTSSTTAVKVTTQEDFDKLQKGDHYINPKDGKTYIKN